MLRRFFPAIVDRTPMLFSEIAAAVAGGAFDAGVLIHEGRFTYERHGLELVADLGALWERQTGLPLPLGAIVARRDLPEEVRRTFDRVLHESIAYAFAHPAVSRPFVREHARELDDEVIDRHIALFVNRHSLSLGEEGRRAVREPDGSARPASRPVTPLRLSTARSVAQNEKGAKRCNLCSGGGKTEQR